MLDDLSNNIALIRHITNENKNKKFTPWKLKYDISTYSSNGMASPESWLKFNIYKI